MNNTTVTMKTKLLSSLVKVFRDEEPTGAEKVSFSALRGERLNFQLAFFCDKETSFCIAASDNDGISTELFLVRDVPVEMKQADKNDNFILRGGEPGSYPDVLAPLTGGRVSIDAGGWYSLWAEFDISCDCPAGERDVRIEAKADGAVLFSREIHLNVIDAVLPEQTLLCTHWFHCDCLATAYDVEVFSERHWEIIENYLRFAVKNGMNFLLTPLFTPPLDTAVGGERPTVQLVGVKVSGGKYSFDFSLLDRWLDMCDRCGVKGYELSHLFTQWGARHAPKIVAEVDGEQKKIFGWDDKATSKKYVEFLTCFAEKFNKYVDKRGIADRCYYHVSDEPSRWQLRPYRKAEKVAHKLFGRYSHIDAMSEFKYYKKGIVDVPVFNIHCFEEFYGKTKENWCYYCCSPNYDGFVNRFIYMPSLRCRALGVLLYKYNVDGFLHWGYNFWYTRYSKAAIDPYKNTTSGGNFPAGDGFLVYPGENDRPVASLRMNVFYDALQDMRALKLLEERIGREKTLAMIEAGLDQPLKFNRFPHEDEWLTGLREKVNMAIAESNQA